MTTHQDEITRFWDTRPGSYDAAAFHGLRSDEERTVWLIELRRLTGDEALDVLDAGTGTGFLALLLAELGHRVVGVDLSEGMLAVAQEKAATLAMPPRLKIGDAIDPPLPPGSFDVVVCRHLLWTLTDPVGALTNWRRLLRPGGRLLAIEWIHPEPGAWEPYSPAVTASLPLRHLPTPEPVVAAAASAGFMDVRAERLDAIEWAERALGGTEGDAPQRYAITGANAATTTRDPHTGQRR